MADPIAIKITNAQQIRLAYARAPALMTKNLSIAIKTAVFLIEGKMKPNIPVLTGRLRGSSYTKFAPLRGEVGTNTNYDRFVHDGTKFMKGRPYLKMAVDDSSREVQELFTKAAQDVLNDIGRSV
jgi:HK97 gp10 family phage protein